MPTYQVTLQRRTWLTDRPHNPFLCRIGDGSGAPSSYTTVREWTFKARSEKHVRELYQEAKDKHLDQVIGFELVGIKKIATPAAANTESEETK